MAGLQAVVSRLVLVLSQLSVVEPLSIVTNVVEEAGKAELPSNDWVISDTHTTLSRFKTSSSLKCLVDVVDILDPSIVDNVLSLRRCSSTNLVSHDRSNLNSDFSTCMLV